MSTTVKVQIQQRIDTASNWTTANPTLLAGEVGWESDTKKYKIGDGSTAWASLTYAPGSGGYTAGTGVSISASNVITASAVALTTVQTAGSQSAMLSLTTQEGDVVVRSDENKSYVRNSGTAGSMADFTLLATPTDAVLSVNGNTGAITADQLAAAIESASDSNTFTDADHTKLNSALTTSDLLDEDNFATNSATKAPSQQSTKAYVDANSADTLYAISCVDGDNADEEKIRLTAGGSGSGTDDIVLEAGTGLSIARSSDKITFTNTVSNTDTQLTEEQVEDFVGGMLTGNTETGITVTYQDSDGTIDFEVTPQTKSDIDALNINADTVDSLHAASFLRSDADDATTGTLTINNGADEKIVLQGTNDPYVRWREGSTDKAYIQWSSGGYLYFKNQEDGSGLQLKDDIVFSTDGTNWNKVWHGGNDGSGSGLDADTLDGVQGASYLRSDTNDTFNGSLTINTSSNEALSVTGPSAPYIRLKDNTNANRSYWQYSSGDVWIWNEYRGQGLKLSTQPYFWDASAYREIIHQNNVGSSGALSNSSVYVDKLYATDGVGVYNSGWNYFESTTSGLYWNGGSAAGWHIYPSDTNYMRFRSGASNQVGIEMKTTDNTTRGYVYANNGYQIGFLNQSQSWILRCDSSLNTTFFGAVYPYANNSYSLGTSNNRWNTIYGTTVYDGKGDVRKIPQNYQASNYTLVASDSGKHILADGNITWTDNTFGAGDAITIVNASGGDITITKGTNMYNSADGTNANRTLASKGMATILWASGTSSYISGAGLS